MGYTLKSFDSSTGRNERGMEMATIILTTVSGLFDAGLPNH